MTHNRVGDAAHQGPPQPTEAAATHDHEARSQLFAQLYYGSGRPFVHLQVGPNDGNAQSFDTPNLIVEDPLGLPPLHGYHLLEAGGESGSS